MSDDIIKLPTESRDRGQVVDDSTQCAPKTWLSPKEAAKYIGVSQSKIYKLVADEKIPFHRVPESRLLKLHIGELDEWMRKGNEDEKIAEKEVEKLMERV